LRTFSPDELREQRYRKFRTIGVWAEGIVAGEEPFRQSER
jgi:hypothetical protein